MRFMTPSDLKSVQQSWCSWCEIPTNQTCQYLAKQIITQESKICIHQRHLENLERQWWLQKHPISALGLKREVWQKMFWLYFASMGIFTNVLLLPIVSREWATTCYLLLEQSLATDTIITIDFGSQRVAQSKKASSICPLLWALQSMPEEQSSAQWPTVTVHNSLGKIKPSDHVISQFWV